MRILATGYTLYFKKRICRYKSELFPFKMLLLSCDLTSQQIENSFIHAQTLPRNILFSLSILQPFFSEFIPIEKGCKDENDRVAFSESGPIHLLSLSISLSLFLSVCLPLNLSLSECIHLTLKAPKMADNCNLHLDNF